MVSFARADRTRGDTIFKLKIEGQTGVSLLSNPIPLFDFLYFLFLFSNSPNYYILR